jgi:carboxyl-terminal processing protease
MDAVVIGGDLGEALGDEVGEAVDGLLGYSFLKHYRIGIDSRHRLLWFDPARGDVADRPYEYSHLGIQLEDSSGAVRVIGVASDSPAARSGVEVGDELLAIDGQSVAGVEVVTAARRLEGMPGTPVDLTLRRGRHEWTCRLLRKQLLQQTE